jgi:hypothetical protein
MSNAYLQAAGASRRANLAAALAGMYTGSLLPRGGAGVAGGSGLPSENPYASYLRGSADLIDAQGRYGKSLGEAHQLRAMVRRQEIETQRRAFEEHLYERDNTPTLKDEQERAQRHELCRSQNNPPVTEVCSSKALNDLLVHLQELQAKSAGGEPIALEESILKRIKVSAGRSGLGVLQEGGQLDWPSALRKEAFRNVRADVERLAPVAVNEAVNGRVTTETLRAFGNSVDALRRRLTAAASDLPPARYFEAKRFVNNLEDALKVLEKPDAGDYFSGKYAARGKTVQELVKYMTENGLRFAPAMAGDEAAYEALHRALVAGDNSAQSKLVARP